MEILDSLRFHEAMIWLVGLQVLHFHSVAIDSYFIQQVFNTKILDIVRTCLPPWSGRINTIPLSLLAAWEINWFPFIEDDFILPFLTAHLPTH